MDLREEASPPNPYETERDARIARNRLRAESLNIPHLSSLVCPPVAKKTCVRKAPVKACPPEPRIYYHRPAKSKAPSLIISRGRNQMVHWRREQVVPLLLASARETTCLKQVSSAFAENFNILFPCLSLWTEAHDIDVKRLHTCQIQCPYF